MIVFGKTKVKALQDEVHALYLCARYQKTPLFTKLFALLIVGYALSPIDLIPDFIPVLGYADDLILLPLGIGLFYPDDAKDISRKCREVVWQDPRLANLNYGQGRL